MDTKSLVLPILLGSMFSATSLAATLPVSEDTFSYPPAKIDKRTGNASTLPLSADGTAFIRFDAGDFSGLIKPSDVTSARLTFYITDVAKAGKIGIHRVTSEWTESPAAPRGAPSFDPSPIASIPPKAVRAGQFAVVDVTEQVRKWLEDPQSDRGFAITGAGDASIQIRAKEGSAPGMPASLEIDNRPVVGNGQLADGINAVKLGRGEVSNAEFAQLDGVKAPIQEQIDGLKSGTGSLGGAVKALQTGLTAVEGEVDTLQTAQAALESADDGLTETIEDILLDIDGLGTYDGYLKETMTDLDANNVKKTGSTMTGTLNVQGNVKLGASAEYSAVAGDEDLRIVRASFRWDGVDATLASGAGFTWTRNAGVIEITFNKPFSGIPSVSLGAGYPEKNTNTHESMISATATKVTFRPSHFSSPSMTDVLIIGPR